MKGIIKIMLRFVFASHHKMAEGLRDTVEFLTQTDEKLYDISAYITDEFSMENAVKELFENFNREDTVVVMTDILSGSVNQKFYPYLSEKVHVISGINVPLAVALVLAPEESINDEYIEEAIEEAKSSIVYVNRWETNEDEDDE
jgi:fructoselysine and glucoselysine-specific PTS system IIA component